MRLFNKNASVIEDGINRIPDGIPFNYDNITIRITGSNLLVTWWTNTVHYKNITKSKIEAELLNLKTNYLDLARTYDELNDIVDRNDLTIEFHIAYDDAGKGSVGLCSEINGIINWYI